VAEVLVTAPRAGVVVTGTEVLTGRVLDRNGPWLSERLRELGVEHSFTAVVGDRPADLHAALAFFAAQGIDLVVTSGGLGPTEDDLTTAIVAEFCGRPMVLDEALEQRIAAIVAPLRARYRAVDPAALAAGTRKQATVPEGALVLEPVGTAPGVVVAPVAGGGPVVAVLPGPPRELQGMWPAAIAAPAVRAVLERAGEIRQAMLRLFGIPESEIAETLRAARREGVELDAVEVTTCLRGGEVEVVTRYAPEREAVYHALAGVVRARHADTLFSEDGSSVDDQVAAALVERGLTIGTAESCTGGLLAARLTARAGSSAYVLGGIVAYANEAKVALAGVDPGLIERHGAVSLEVAEALAEGACERLGVDVGVGITGIAGPGGGTPDKPVGTVCVSVVLHDDAGETRRVVLPGSRAEVRDRTTTLAMHLVRRLLVGEPA
jgi:nicotinamide-nucleotide amidase